jgi:Cwf15/Cwc15 cell cycle control protein
MTRLSLSFADLIFKNQAAKDNSRNGQFVNDLLRTEFHKSVFSIIRRPFVAHNIFVHFA